MYTPDNYVIIKIIDNETVFYKLLVGWSGGYLDGDSWRMNSGITRVEETNTAFIFHSESGSTYNCGKLNYGLRFNNAYVWQRLKEKYGEKLELMDETTDWMKMNENWNK